MRQATKNMRDSFSFLGIPSGYFKSAPQNQANRCTLSRREAGRLGLAASVIGILGLLPDQLLAAEDNGGRKSGIADRLFAEEMERGMIDYEKNIASIKEKLFAEVSASDVIADIGIGTGPNLQYLPKGSTVIGVDPNEYMWPFALEKAKQYGITLRVRHGVCEDIPLQDETCDIVITTLTLCSVKSPTAAIKEILRVLKPGGIHIFIEHVIASPSRPLFRLAQNVLNPLQVALANGCHMNRDTAQVLRQAQNPGYSKIHLENFDAHFGFLEDFVNPVRPHIAGCAQKQLH